MRPAFDAVIALALGSGLARAAFHDVISEACVYENDVQYNPVVRWGANVRSSCDQMPWRCFTPSAESEPAVKALERIDAALSNQL